MPEILEPSESFQRTVREISERCQRAFTFRELPVARELPESFERASRELPESFQRAARELSGSCQSFQRADSCQRAFRERPEIFQRLARGLSKICQHPCTETCGDKVLNSFSVCNCSLSLRAMHIGPENCQHPCIERYAFETRFSIASVCVAVPVRGVHVSSLQGSEGCGVQGSILAV